MKHRLKPLINKSLAKFGLQLISTQRTGIDFVNEIRRTEADIRVALDVGANIGVMSEYLLHSFPNALIHAFEPVEANFSQIKKKSGPRLVVNRLAMGAEIGRSKIYLSSHPSMHSAVVVEDEDKYETVDMCTVDDYCETKDIEHIGLLKVDTEGNDLNVLLGAKRFIDSQKIDFLLLEAGFYAKPRHIDLCSFLSHLTTRGYYLFGIYEQAWRRGGNARIDFANVLFAREGLSAIR